MKKVGFIVILAIAVVGCKEKPKLVSVAEGPTQVPVEEGVKEEVKKPEEVKKEKLVLSPEERAAKLGFAKHLPAETEMALSVFQVKESFDKMKALKAIGIIQERRALMEAEFGMDEEMLEEDIELELEEEQGALEDEAPIPNEAPVEEDAPVEDAPLAEEDVPFAEEEAEGGGAWTLFGQEVTVAFGKGSGEQMGHLLKMNDRMTFFQSSAVGKAVLSLLKTGDMEAFDELISGNLQSESFVQFLQDPESGVALLDKAAMPPMYIAFRAKEGELDQAAQMVSSSMAFFAMAGPMVAPVEIQTGGTKFVGYKLLGAKMAEMMRESRESMEEDMKPEAVDALLSSISKKNLIFTTGTIGDYVVVMIGGDESTLQLVTDPKDSLGASEKMNFVDEFSDRPLIAVSYGDQKTLKTIMDEAGGVGSYVLGFREGIKGGEEMRDIEELLQLFAEREKSLLEMTSASAFGMVAYADEGLKIDSFGGLDRGNVDWNMPTRLAHLGDSPDNLLFLSYPSNAAYNEEMMEYFEILAETAYAMTSKFSKLEIEDPKMIQMKEYFNMFDKDLREDMLGMYQAVAGDMMDGLGQESAFVIDMKGAMPALPGVPQEIADKGKAPRLSMIAPVNDRAKLAEAWKKMNSHSTALLGKMSEMFDKKMPMQKPIKIDNNGIATWFISIPFMQDDFMPSVTLNDQWFVASSSKLQAVDLIDKAKQGGDSGQGIKFRMNFKVLSDYSEEMFKLVDENIATIIKDEEQRAEFMTEKESYLKMIEATREFDSLSWDVRKEDGQVRSRIHLKMN